MEVQLALQIAGHCEAAEAGADDDDLSEGEELGFLCHCRGDAVAVDVEEIVWSFVNKTSNASRKGSGLDRITGAQGPRADR